MIFMNFLLISSEEDMASINFKNVLLKDYPFDKFSEDLFILNDNTSKNKIYFLITERLHLHITDDDLVNEYLKKNNIKIDMAIFLSRHSTLGEIKPKSMTVHSIGNFGKAELGGKDYTLVKTDPILIRLLLLELKKNKPKELKEFEIKQEATHHGPFLETSAIFYEIGSKKEEWENEIVAKFMTSILISVLKTYDQKEIIQEKGWIPTVGLGGSHYCTKFSRLTFDENQKYCFGHIAADYAMKDISSKPELTKQALEKSNAENIISEKEIS